MIRYTINRGREETKVITREDLISGKYKKILQDYGATSDQIPEVKEVLDDRVVLTFDCPRKVRWEQCPTTLEGAENDSCISCLDIIDVYVRSCELVAVKYDASIFGGPHLWYSMIKLHECITRDFEVPSELGKLYEKISI